MVKINNEILELARELIDGLTVREPSLEQLLDIHARLGQGLRSLGQVPEPVVETELVAENEPKNEPTQELLVEPAPEPEEEIETPVIPQSDGSEVLESAPAGGLRRFFSINDYFYYSRVLYGGDRRRFQHLLDRLSMAGSLDEVYRVLTTEEKLDLSDGPGRELYDRLTASRFF